MPSTSDLADPKEYQKIFHWAETQKDGSIPSFATRRNDPYEVCEPPQTRSELALTLSLSTKQASATRMLTPACSDSTG